MCVCVRVCVWECVCLYTQVVACVFVQVVSLGVWV